jgi:hypothetical protein
MRQERVTIVDFFLAWSSTPRAPAQSVTAAKPKLSILIKHSAEFLINNYNTHTIDGMV